MPGNSRFLRSFVLQSINDAREREEVTQEVCFLLSVTEPRYRLKCIKSTHYTFQLYAYARTQKCMTFCPTVLYHRHTLGD